MRRVIGIGETILDILFRNGQPYTALPGGSIFNTLVSLSRVGVQTSFIGELGDDRVGQIIRHFMQQNGMSTDYMDSFSEGLSPVSLAFLDEGQGTDYMFYTNRSKRRSNMALPDIQPDDIVLFGSYYALNPATASWTSCSTPGSDGPSSITTQTSARPTPTRPSSSAPQ